MVHGEVRCLDQHVESSAREEARATPQLAPMWNCWVPIDERLADRLDDSLGQLHRRRRLLALKDDRAELVATEAGDFDAAADNRL